MALPSGYYGKIAPRSRSFSIKNVHRCGDSVIDGNYKGELGVTLFKFSEENFIVDMGDKIAQLIIEKIKTP